MTPLTDPEADTTRAELTERDDDAKRRAHVPHTSCIQPATPQSGAAEPTPEGHPQAATAADIEHHSVCTGVRIVERESAHRRLIICAGCGALVSAPKVARWQEADQ